MARPKSEAQKLADSQDILNASIKGFDGSWLASGKLGDIVGDNAQRATDDITSRDKAQQDIEDKNAANLAKLRGEATDFRSNLPGYTDRQINSAGDSARSNLTNDLYNVKTNANSRGLLYSGVNEGNQGLAKSYASAKLGKDIQGINQDANSLADYKDELVSEADRGDAAQKMSYDQFQAARGQTSYQQALAQQQNSAAFYKDIMGAASTAALMAAMGPGGAVAGAGVNKAIHS